MSLMSSTDTAVYWCDVFRMTVYRPYRRKFCAMTLLYSDISLTVIKIKSKIIDFS